MAKEAAAAEVVEEATATIIAYFLQLIINNLFGSRNTQLKSKRGKQRGRQSGSQREEEGKKRSEERVRAKLRINSSNSSPGERPNLPQIETPDCLSLPSSPSPYFVAASDSHCERVNCCHKVYAGWMSALKSACACKHHIKTSRGDRHASPARPESESESKSERGAENIPLPSCPPTAAAAAAASAAALDHRLCSDFGLTHGPDSRPCLAPASLWLQRVLRQQFVLLAQP